MCTRGLCIRREANLVFLYHSDVKITDDTAQNLHQASHAAVRHIVHQAATDDILNLLLDGPFVLREMLADPASR